MFGLFTNKKKQKEKIDSLLIEKMREYSDVTEKSYRNFISYMKEDFPNDQISLSIYGIYKARFGTNLMVAIGAQFSKSKIGYGSGQEMFNDIQIASALAHEPFSQPQEIDFIDKSTIAKQTEEIIEYIVKAIKPYQEELYKSNIDNSAEYFSKLKIYFHNCIAECISEKELQSKIIDIEDIYFQNITNQNLNILIDFMKI
ncbi:hypothetical protein GCM10011344_36280 [Dokdonia pacifica]|uniref:Uncharacterized protein n=1 Tax=Dokdonia pacifica TaxID=1627892 RepID=A0A239AW64_9FLAO|nr:hypothetical protein [Dokdonia pacifica]GGG32115.1 hypothetical protein GCM10011344_36280 [Dokdonia pacifica]SNR99847.1 hypothetical protein SAMN06265376_105175 [Dokdonia pacifica]